MKKTSKKSAPRSSYHETGILLEEIRHQVQIIAEGVDVNNQKIASLEGKIVETRTGLEEKIMETKHLLHAKILENEQNLRADMIEMKQDIQKEIKETRKELSSKIDAIGVRLDHHDEEIHRLKQAQNSG